MAQWLQQFSGLNHATKVADLEVAMHVAASAFHNASPSEKATKANAVLRLATRLWAARFKAIKAQRIAVGSLTGPNEAAERIRIQEDAIQAAGVNAVLTEFRVADAIAE